MSGALVRVILNLLLAYVTFNPFIPALCSFKKNSISWGNANQPFHLCGKGFQYYTYMQAVHYC